MNVEKVETSSLPDGTIATVKIEFGKSPIPHACMGCRYAAENPDGNNRTCRRPVKKRLPLLQNYAWLIYNKMLELINALEAGDKKQFTESEHEFQDLNSGFQDNLVLAWERLATGASHPGGGTYKWCHSREQDEIEQARKARKESKKK